jgi:flagellar basal-body rod modification protein FlgD
MDITALASRATAGATSTAASADAAGKATLDYSAFLKLLIAQMQNQDPLEPMKSSDYVAQLATFSQVEKSVEMNSRMSELLATVQLQQAGSLIGQTIASADGEVSGRVAAAKIVDGSVVAVLEDGRELTVGPDVLLGGRAA